MTEPGVKDGIVQPNYEGAFVLGPFSMQENGDKLRFTDTAGELVEFDVPHVRGFLKASMIHSIDGFPAEEVLMAWILNGAESPKPEHAELAREINRYLDSKEEMRGRVNEKRKQREVLHVIQTIKRDSSLGE